MAKQKTKTKNIVKKPRVRRAEMVKTSGVRNFRCYMLIGSKGCGKSTAAMDGIDDYFEDFSPSHKKSGIHSRVWVHDYSSSRAFADIPTAEDFIARIEKKIKKTIKINHPYGKTVSEDGIKKPVKVLLRDFPMEVLNLKKRNGDLVWSGKDFPMLRVVSVDSQEITRMYALIMANLQNAMVVLDEINAYYPDRPTSAQRGLAIKHRNIGLEVVYMCHGLYFVPRFFAQTDMIYKYVIFDTKETINKKKIEDRFGVCSERVYQAALEVKKKGRTEYRVQPHVEVIV